MVSITLKDIPDGLRRNLRKRAEANGRSLNREIIEILKQVAQPRRHDQEQYLDRIRRLRSRIEIHLTQEDIEAAITRGRA